MKIGRTNLTKDHEWQTGQPEEERSNENFEDLGLKITAQTNQTRQKILLIQETKKNDSLFISSHSNHPPSILRKIPYTINEKIFQLSCDQTSFETAAPLYEQTMKHSNFQPDLQYINGDLPNETSSQRKRRRSIIRFNPPFSKCGRSLLSFIDKHFPVSSNLHKILNRNTVKVSYSGMANTKYEISKHNAHILSAQKKSNSNGKSDYNCRRQNECLLSGHCQTTNVIYKTEVTTTDNGQSK